MIKKLSVEIRGITPLLMNNNKKSVNPTHPLVREMKAISAKRKKTEDDDLRILEIKWYLGIYWEDGIGPYVPSENVFATLREAAKVERKGKDVIKGMFVTPEFIPVDYDGPRTQEALFASDRYKDIRVGRIKTSSILLCRPRFNVWGLKFDIEYDTNVLQRDDVLKFLEYGGRYVGLCDFRPRYGQFEVLNVKG